MVLIGSRKLEQFQFSVLSPRSVDFHTKVGSTSPSSSLEPQDWRAESLWDLVTLGEPQPGPNHNPRTVWTQKPGEHRCAETFAAALLPVSGDVATGIRTWEPLTLVFYQLTLVCAKKNLCNLHKDSNQTLKPKLNCGLGSRQSGRGLGRDTLQFLQMSVEVAKINIRVCLLDNKNDGD